MNDEIPTEDVKDTGIGVGAILRASRIRHGHDLRDVAELLCVRYPYMEAIENGRYEELPGPTYAVGFIRAYACHLGLDSDEVVRRFREDVTAGKSQAELHFPTPVLETSIPSGAIISVGIVIAVIAYGGWYMGTAEDGFISGLIEPLPQRFSALMSSKDNPSEKPRAKATPPTFSPLESDSAVEASPPAVPTPITPIAAGPIIEASPPAMPTPITPIAAGPIVEAQQPDPQQIVVETLAPPAAKPASVSSSVETPQPILSEQATVTPEAVDATPPSDPTPSLTYRQITVRANRDSWFEIIDEFGGGSLAARTLLANEEYRVPNRSGLLLVTGNAGALEILIDGESLPPLGKDGAVLRGVRLDADMLLNGTAISE